MKITFAVHEPLFREAKASASAVNEPIRLQGLPPLVTGDTRMLVLGSFPSATSLARQQYYAHPQNAFWRLLQAIWPASPMPGADQYQQRVAWLLDKGLGLWDVYASCERDGSLDSAIRQPQVNDLAGLLRRCPGLRLIAHNGGESFRHARFTRTLGLPVYRLPSTSPANASWSFERKLAVWREVVTPPDQHMESGQMVREIHDVRILHPIKRNLCHCEQCKKPSGEVWGYGSLGLHLRRAVSFSV